MKMPFYGGPRLLAFATVGVLGALGSSSGVAAAAPSSVASVTNNVTTVQAAGLHESNQYDVSVVGGLVQITDLSKRQVMPGSGCSYYFYGLTWSVRCSGTAGVNLFSGAGDDQIGPFASGLPPLVIDGGSSDDRIAGSPSTDVLIGGSGNDKINGGAISGAGDWIVGGGGFDDINGTAGNDLISGGAGADRIRALGGNDSLFQNDGEADGDTECGSGNDTARLDSIDQIAPVGCETVIIG